MPIPVLSKIKFLVRHLWDRLDHILLHAEQAARHSKRQAETLARLDNLVSPVPGQIEALTARLNNHLARFDSHLKPVAGQIDALTEGVDALIANNTLVVEALGRLVKYQAEYQPRVKRIEDWVIAFDAYNSSLRRDAQLTNVIKLNVDRLLSFSKSENREKHEPNAGLLALNPELRLLDHLQKLLPNNILIDVGAHRGDFADFLLRCGYQVYGFEPNPETFAALMSRLAGQPGFRGYEFALSDRDGEGSFTIPKANSASDQDLYEDTSLFCTLEGHPLPQGLVTDRSITVKVRTISSLVEEGLIPGRAGVLKIDVEGHELDVIAGAERLNPDIVIVEFWSSDSEFATEGTLNNSVNLHFALRNKGYPHLITFNRIHGSTETMFHVNCPEAINNSWGNMVFFKEGELFRHALEWCEATLRRVHFGSPPDELMRRATKNHD